MIHFAGCIIYNDFDPLADTGNFCLSMILPLKWEQEPFLDIQFQLNYLLLLVLRELSLPLQSFLKQANLEKLAGCHSDFSFCKSFKLALHYIYYI